MDLDLNLDSGGMDLDLDLNLDSGGMDLDLDLDFWTWTLRTTWLQVCPQAMTSDILTIFLTSQTVQLLTHLPRGLLILILMIGSSEMIWQQWNDYKTTRFPYQHQHHPLLLSSFYATLSQPEVQQPPLSNSPEISSAVALGTLLVSHISMNETMPILLLLSAWSEHTMLPLQAVLSTATEKLSLLASASTSLSRSCLVCLGSSWQSQP